MRVYLSDPMTGLPDHNRPAFDATALRSLGFYMDKANLALAKPPKNCDLHNDVEGAWQDYKQFRRQTGEAIYFDMVHFWSFAKWLFAPAKREGGAE